MKKGVVLLFLLASSIKSVEPITLTMIICAAVGSAACLFVECKVSQQVRECLNRESESDGENEPLVAHFEEQVRGA